MCPVGVPDRSRDGTLGRKRIYGSDSTSKAVKRERVVESYNISLGKSRDIYRGLFITASRLEIVFARPVDGFVPGLKQELG